VRQLFSLLLLAAFALPAFAAEDAKTVKVTVAQLEQALAEAHGKPDGEVARQLSGLELSERLGRVKLEQLKAGLPGNKAREQLLILADLAAFLNPPSAEIPADPTPDQAATHQMLLQIVGYLNTTLHQLPNLTAVRDTIGFEDKPQEDALGATGITTTAAMPLHSVGKSSVTVTYRDHKEVVDEKAMKHSSLIGGLSSWGEFGPVLGVVVLDALQGKMTWSRWEQGANGKEAVFHYSVPSEKSHYPVQFCCIPDGFNSHGSTNFRVFKEIAGYHGDIIFDPASGAVLRIAMEAEVAAGELISKAGIMVEYNSVEIGGEKFICPVRSVSVLMAHTAQQTGMHSRSNYQGTAKTFLNDVAFGQYHRFGSETRILTGDYPDSILPSGPASADSPGSNPTRAPSH
jgi:hypothetical protein